VPSEWEGRKRGDSSSSTKLREGKKRARPNQRLIPSHGEEGKKKTPGGRGKKTLLDMGRGCTPRQSRKERGKKNNL